MDRETADHNFLEDLDEPGDPAVHGTWGFHVYETFKKTDEERDSSDDAVVDKLRRYVQAYVRHRRSEQHRDQLQESLRLMPVYMPGASFSQVRAHMRDNYVRNNLHSRRYTAALVIDEVARDSITSGPEPRDGELAPGERYRKVTKDECTVFAYLLDVDYDESRWPQVLKAAGRGGAGAVEFCGWMKVTPRSLHEIWTFFDERMAGLAKPVQWT